MYDNYGDVRLDYYHFKNKWPELKLEVEKWAREDAEKEKSYLYDELPTKEAKRKARLKYLEITGRKNSEVSDKEIQRYCRDNIKYFNLNGEICENKLYKFCKGLL